MFTKWLHHLFNPHCPLCELEKERALSCESCEMLRQLLETEKFENKQLLSHLLGTDKPADVEIAAPIEIKPKSVPWRVRKEMLESNDRAQAEILRKRSAEIASLEKELGVGDAGDQQKAV